MIRQTISCDMCGADKKETNHWFVALEGDGELRLGTWAALGKRRRGARHLCGQKCLYKLVDDFFVVRANGARAAAEEGLSASQAIEEGATEAGLGAAIDFDDFESSAQLIPPPGKPVRVNMDAAKAMTADAGKTVSRSTAARLVASRPVATKSVSANLATASPVVTSSAATGVAGATKSAVSRKGYVDSAPTTGWPAGSLVVEREAAKVSASPAEVGRSSSGGAEAKAAETLTVAAANALRIERVRQETARMGAPAATASQCERSSSERRSTAEAWRREQARGRQSTTQMRQGVESTRLTPSRIEARLHPILRPSTLEA